MKKTKKKKQKKSSLKAGGKYLLLLVVYICLSVLTGLVVMNFLTKPKEIVIPDIKGESIDEALVKLGDLGLNIRVSGKKYDRAIPPYHVISTEPESFSRVKKGRIVKVVLSKGMVKSFVPELSGKNYLEAELLISKAQLNLGKIIRVHSDTYSENTTISAFPPEETEVASGDKVNLLISSGEREKSFVMPDMTGLPEKEALAIIKAMGVNKGNVKKEWNNVIFSGHIISHNPPAGSLIDERANVDFLISTGKQKSILSEINNGDNRASEIKTYRTYSFTVPADKKGERLVLAKITEKSSEREIYNRRAPQGKLINLFFETVKGTKLSIFLDGNLYFEKVY